MPKPQNIKELAGMKPADPNARYHISIGGVNNAGHPCALIINEIGTDGQMSEWWSSGAMIYNEGGLDLVTLVQQIMSEAIQSLIDIGAQRVMGGAGN